MVFDIILVCFQQKTRSSKCSIINYKLFLLRLVELEIPRPFSLQYLFGLQLWISSSISGQKKSKVILMVKCN